jgi:hypothetical protein
MLVVCFSLTVGCTSVRMTMTARSRMEQKLLVSALDRAVSQTDVRRFAGKRVALELFGLVKDDLPFTKAFIHVWLGKHGIQIVQDPEKADLKIKILAPVLAVDKSETLFGTPEFTFLGIPVPAIAFYRDVRNEGSAEIRIYAFDGQTGKFVEEIPASVGEAKYNRITILFVISWSSTDPGKKPN